MPPWINKFYILDLNPQKSFVKWCLDQGHSVFMVSWINPDAGLADKGWEDYIREGIDFALDTIEEQTDEKRSMPSAIASAARFCLRPRHCMRRKAMSAFAAPHFAAQTDFIHAGDLKGLHR